MSSDLRVLVVDDQYVNRLVLAEIFTHLGCVVSTAEDGLQALAAASVDTFDLVCLDRHMPGLSGDDVVSGLPADQFVLAWSADSSDLPGRFNGMLAKPVSIAAAKDAIAHALARRATVAQRAPAWPPADLSVAVA